MEVIMQGVIVAVLQPEQGVSQRTQQPWVSQSYVLCHEQGQYPRNVCFRVFGQEKIQQMAIRQGEYLIVHLNIDCKQSTNKPGQWFNSIDCWKVERQTQQVYAPQSGYTPQSAPFPVQPTASPFPTQQPVGQPSAPAPFPPAAPVSAPQSQAPFPPQVDANGNPIQQQQPVAQPAPQQQVQQPTQSPLPFPPAQ